VKGRTDARGREPNVIVNKLLTLSEAEKEFTRQIVLFFRRGYHSDSEMKRVREILQRFPGKTPVVVVLETMEETPPSRNGNGAHANGNGSSNGHEKSAATASAREGERLRVILSTSLVVSARPELKQELQQILGTDGCRFQGGPPPGASSLN
jgi:DNA polymerase-3 subunit alpha